MIKKFQCNNCKKPYKGLMGAFSCPCQNKIKWNYPKGGRQKSVQQEWNRLIKRELNEESRRHEKIIKMRKI